MEWRRRLVLALRAVFLVVLAYAAASYALAVRRTAWPWRVKPVDPFARESPLSVQVEVKGGELVLRVYRSHSEPFARSIRLNVTVCGDACTFYLLAERMPPGSLREYAFHLSGKGSCEVYVSASLEGRLVLSQRFSLGC
ncbi:MAG: hypothetical protein QXM80_03650 [Thermofilaceae archaeon]